MSSESWLHHSLEFKKKNVFFLSCFMKHKTSKTFCFNNSSFRMWSHTETRNYHETRWWKQKLKEKNANIVFLHLDDTISISSSPIFLPKTSFKTQKTESGLSLSCSRHLTGVTKKMHRKKQKERRKTKIRTYDDNWKPKQLKKKIAFVWLKRK